MIKLFTDKVIEFPETILKISEYLKHLYNLRTYDDEAIPILNYDENEFKIFNEWFKPLNEMLKDDDVEKWYVENFNEEYLEKIFDDNNQIFYSSFFEKFTTSQKIQLFNFALGNQFKIMCESIAFTMRNEKVYKKNDKYFICTGFNEETEQFETFNICLILANLIDKWKKTTYKPENNLFDIHFHRIARKYSWSVLYKLYILWKKYGFEYFKTRTFSSEFAEIYQLFDITELSEIGKIKNTFNFTCLRPGDTIDEENLIMLDKENEKYKLYFAFSEDDSFFNISIEPTFHNFLAFINGCIKYECTKMNGIYPIDDSRYEIDEICEKKVLLIGFDDEDVNVVCTSPDKLEANLQYVNTYRNVIKVETNFISSFRSLQEYLIDNGFRISADAYSNILMSGIYKPNKEKILQIFKNYENFVKSYINSEKEKIMVRLREIENSHKQELKEHLEE